MEHPTPGYLIWRLSMKWRAAADRAVAPLGLTQAQFSLLASLYGISRAGREPSQRELAEHTGLEPVFVSKLVRTLEGAGLVERAAHPTDSRAVRLTLTEHGSDIALRAIAVIRDLQEEITAPLGGTQSPRTRAFLDSLHALLGTDHDRSATMTRTPLLTGQDIGTATNATRALLDVLLERAGTTFPEWVAMRSLATRGADYDRDAFRQFLVDGLAVQPSAVPPLIAELEAKGLIRPDADDGPVDLTPQGRALYDEINAGVARVTEQIYGDLPPDDLAVTHRILAQVTERAKELRHQL